jgi:hypothetical protein
MERLDGIDQIFSEAGTPYSIVGLNGRIIQGTINSKVIEDLFLNLSRKMQSLGVGVYLFSFPYVIFKISSNSVLIMHTKVGKTAFTSLGNRVMQQYRDALEEKFSNTPLNIADLVKSYLFSMNRVNGPEAIASFVPSTGQSMEMVDEFKLSMNSLMILSNQTMAQNRDILTFLPLLETNDLGLVFIFKIPLCDARGGAYDSSIMAIVDYEYRDIVYRYSNRLERVFKHISEDFKSTFQNLFGGKIDEPVEDRTPFLKLIEQLHGMLTYISIKPISSEPLKDSMVDAVTEFQKYFSK